jgi:hypothetical protein
MRKLGLGEILRSRPQDFDGMKVIMGILGFNNGQIVVKINLGADC